MNSECWIPQIENTKSQKLDIPTTSITIKIKKLLDTKTALNSIVPLWHIQIITKQDLDTFQKRNNFVPHFGKAIKR
jgi:hypothetical protein